MLLSVARFALTLSFVLAVGNAWAGADLPREAFLAVRADGHPGSGSAGDPFDASTAEKFDGVLARYSQAGVAGVTFRLAPGVYRTRGCWKGWQSAWHAHDGWSFVGAGMGNTTIKLDRITYADGTDYPEMTVLTLSREQKNLAGCEVRDLTIDGSFSDFGGFLAEDFLMPGPGQVVAVTLKDSRWARAHAGKLITILRRRDRSSLGIFRLTDVLDSRRIGLRAVVDKRFEPHPPAGARVVAAEGIYVAPALCVSGLWLPAKNARATRVRVTNVARPIYEGPVGIAVGYNFADGENLPARGNQVTECQVDTTWGRFGWLMATFSNDARNPASCVWSGNQLFGNGHDIQGFGGYGWGHSLIQGNTVADVSAAVYCDTWLSPGNVIAGNVFRNVDVGLALGGGDSYPDWVLAGNVMRVRWRGAESYGNAPGLTISGNVIELAAPAARDVSIAPSDLPQSRVENNTTIPFTGRK